MTPWVILTILRPCTTGGTKGVWGEGDSARGHRGQRSKSEKKWNNVEEDRRGKAR